MRTIDFTVESDPELEEIEPKCNSFGFCYKSDFEIRLIRPDDVSNAVIETVFTEDDYTAAEYIRHVTSSGHRRRLRSPSTVVVSFHSTTLQTSRFEPKVPFKNPIAVVSICFGGSHCLIYQIEPWRLYRRDELAHCPIKKVLEDSRFTIVGLEMKKFVEKVKEEWGCDVANKAVDLRSVVAEAYGNAKFDVQRATCEEMAGIILGMKVRKKDKKAMNFDWNVIGDREDDEMLMFAARDSFLVFEIANKCFQKLNRKI